MHFRPKSRPFPEINRAGFRLPFLWSPKGNARAADETIDPLIDLNGAIDHVRRLSEAIGPRFPGSENETKAADYVARRLVDTGRPVELQFFDLPNGARSRNVSIFLSGFSTREFVIGAHLDSTSDSPGANDNASGVAVVLELARLFSREGSPADLRFIFFGGEELVKKGQLHHHFGSRNFVGSLIEEERKNITGMISIDMAGCGEGLKVHSSGPRSSVLRDGLIAAGESLGIPVELLSSHAASDHESFERVGIPACWIGYFRDHENHTPRDTLDRVEPANLDKIARVVFAYIQQTCAGEEAA